MKGSRRRFWSVIAAGVITLAALAALYAVWRSKNRADLATFGAFAVAVVALALGWIAWAWRAGSRKADDRTSGRELDVRADLLAEAVLDQWTRAANERGLLAPEPIPVRWETPALPLTGSPAAAAGSRRFEPLPGVPPVSEARLAEGHIEDLHAVYAGLGSGRLVIAGPPGSGKSGAAVLLVLSALRFRAQVADAEKPKVPVPLLFTAYDWDPSTTQIGDWLAEQMRQTYPMFGAKAGAPDAAALVAKAKVALILDGLDEMAEDLRPLALQALSQQAPFRVVVLSRTAEMAAAASKKGILVGAAAVELRSIDPDTAAEYLSRVQLSPPPAGWEDLLARIRGPESPLARSLDNPLTLTLVRDTYLAGDDARELLEFCADQQRQLSASDLSEVITDHLLDRVLPAAYAHQPGERAPSYDLQIAERTLRNVAVHMNHDQTRDLRWWHLPEWAPAAPRFIVGGLVAGLAGGLAGRVEFGLAGGLAFGLGIGLGGALMSTLPGTPKRTGTLRLRQALTWPNFVLLVVLGLIGGLSGGLARGPSSGLILGLVAMLVVAAFIAVEDAFEDPESDESLSPLSSYRADTRFALAFGLVAGLGVGFLGLAAGFVVGRTGGLSVWLGIGLASFAFGLALGLSYYLGSEALRSSFAVAQLAWRWHTPIRFMKFLDDANNRGILRTVGPVYQFRHARLQDRLAEREDSPLTTSSETSTKAPLTGSDTNLLQAD